MSEQCQHKLISKWWHFGDRRSLCDTNNMWVYVHCAGYMWGECMCVWQQSVNLQMNFQSHDASLPPSASSSSSLSPPQLISQLLRWLQEEWRQHWFHTSALFFILWKKTCVSVSQRTSISFFYLQMQKKNSLNVSPGPVYKTKKSGTELENVMDAVQSADVISLTYVLSCNLAKQHYVEISLLVFLSATSLS